MPRFEKRDDTQGRYWEITLKGTVVVTRTGKIGPGPKKIRFARTLDPNFDVKAAFRGGRVIETAHADVTAAKADLDRQIAKHERDGWKLVATAATPVTTTALLDEQLEAAIRENPNERTPYSVYADWLQQQGDPRGELIAMQLAQRDRSDPLEFMTFKRRGDELRASHAHVWLGPRVAASDYRVKLDWSNGFVSAARLEGARNPGETPTIELVAELFGSPCGRLCRELALRGRPAEVSSLPDELPATLARVTIEVEATDTSSVEPLQRSLERRNIRCDLSTYRRDVWS